MSERNSGTNEGGRVGRLMKLGAEVVGGGLTGAAAGFFIGGPAGSAIGGAAGPIVKRGFLEIVERALSRREEVRVSAAAQFAIERYQAVLAAGQTPRKDWPDARTDTEELIEGILQKARNSYQEKKVRLIGNIFADFAFTEGVSVEEAHAVLNMVESMTYRQLVLLEIVRSEKGKGLRNGDYRGQNPGTLGKLAILEDVYQLSLRGLVVSHGEDATTSDFMMGWHDVNPAQMKLTPLGTLVCSLAGTDVIAEADKRPLIDALRQ